jgi:tryptophan 2,3-dioxygenase
MGEGAMKAETCKKIKQALENDLGNAADNLYRARSAFNGLSADAMEGQYGQSGETRQQILDGYQKWYDEAKSVLDDYLADTNGVAQ